MLSVTINSEKYNIPTGWYEVTWGQYLKLLHPLKLTELLSVFTGLEIKLLSKSKMTGLEPVLIALSFVNEGMNIPEIPKKLGEFILPGDITLQSVDQYWMLQSEIQKSSKEETIKDRMKYIANYAALYCQSLDEEFDYNKSIELAKSFDSYSCIEVLSAGTFFLNKLISIDKNLPMSFLLSITRWKNLKQGSRTSIKRSVTTQRSTRSLGTSKKMTKR